MFDLQFEPTHEAASRARQEARALLDAAGVPPDIAADIELVIGELTSNAVDQASPLPVSLGVAITDDSIVLTVANQTSGSTPSAFPTDDDRSREHELLSERGRGLAIVKALTDEMWIDTDEESTRVRCVRRFGSSSS